jgi:hypothetical protein
MLVRAFFHALGLHHSVLSGASILTGAAFEADVEMV